MLLNIDFKQYKNALNIRQNGNKKEIFDPVRRKYLLLQPEELVRQLVLQYLMSDRKYPLGKLRTEIGLQVNELQKRCDVLAYDSRFNPMLLVECKAANIPINQSVFEQIGRYNRTFKVPFLLVTNGLATFCSKIDFDTEGYEFLNEIPLYF